MNKFRVFDLSQKRYVTDEADWVIHKNGQLGINGAMMQRNDFVYEYKSDICDTLGTDIYDGDILPEGIVRKLTTGWYLENKDDDLLYPMDMLNYSYKIIGNIHFMK